MDSADPHGPCRLRVLQEDGSFAPMIWGKGFVHERFHWGERLMCSTDDNRIDFFARLVSRIPAPYSLTYILEDDVPCPEFPRGRYVARNALTLEQVVFFLRQFEDFLTGDGRHHVTVGSIEARRTVVFDQHDYFFFYGDLESLKNELKDEHFVQRGDYAIGTHQHIMQQGCEPLRRLLDFWEWRRQDLEITDTYHPKSRIKYVRMKAKALFRDYLWRFRKK